MDNALIDALIVLLIILNLQIFIFGIIGLGMKAFQLFWKERGITKIETTKYIQEGKWNK